MQQRQVRQPAPPRSVVDTDRKAYDAMISAHKARQARQAQPDARSLAEGLDRGAHVTEGGQAASEVMGSIMHDADALMAADALKRFTGPVGNALSIGAAVSNYLADVRGGMSKRAATLKNGLEWGASTGGAGAGAVLGGELGSVAPGLGTVGGAAVGGVLGGLGGSEWARRVSDRALEKYDTLKREAPEMNYPAYWMNRLK
ncbi:hypothetical protein [Phenylobacterium aquaticum]|uniref:hypothetical protein n=1 Tax=Phenylobacterium aquaticum TaxID=1763816 RepID=UPI001F5D5D9F|nr:hypothetical protein [Phenylobacterium aquaticum]MCI3131456.1 hypothetical protein [Phenylobacterium aquaticum]